MARITSVLFTLTICLVTTGAFAQQSGPTMLIFKNSQNAIVENLTWSAPTENTDGTAIDYALTYQLYIDDQATSTFPGTLNETGLYSYRLADVAALAAPGSYSLTLTAFPEGVDLATEPERESDPSNAIVITAIEVVRPKNPADLSTE